MYSVIISREINSQSLLDPGQPRLPRPAAEEQVDSSGGERWRDPEEREQLHRDLLAR